MYANLNTVRNFKLFYLSKFRFLLNMQALTAQERNKLKTVVKLIESFKLQLIENGLTPQQITSYFHHVINETLYTSQTTSQKFDLNQIITSILLHQNGGVLKTLRKLEIAFYLERNQLQNNDSEEAILRKQPEARSDKIIQKKNEIKEKRKKQTKQEKKNDLRDESENIQIEKSQSSKLKPFTNIDVQISRDSNPLKESSNVFPNISDANQFPNTKSQPRLKNFFIPSQQIEDREELAKSLFEINLLKQILQKKMSSGFEEDGQYIEQNDAHEFLNLAALTFGR